MFSVFVWSVIRLLYTLEIHSGYDLWVWRLVPFYGGAPMHDCHHKDFDCNFSDCFTYLDRLFGTFKRGRTADDAPAKSD